MTPNFARPTRPGRRNKKPPATALVFLAVVVLAAACGSTKPTAASTPAGPKVAAAVALAAQKSLDANSADVSLHLTLKAIGSPNVKLGVSGVEAIAPASRASKLTMSVTAPISENLQLSGIGTYQYIEVPPSLASLLPTGIKWISVDYQTLLGTIAASNNAPELAVGATTSPLSYIYLVAHAKLVDLSGGTQETVDGVPMTKYSATVDLRHPPSPLAADENSAYLMNSSGVQLLIWIDSTRKIRQIELSGKIALRGASTPSPDLSITANFSNYGLEVRAVTPPRAETMPQSAATIASVLASALG